jgi:hypothetical protein
LQLFDRENLATALDDLLFISSDTAGNLGQFLELNKLSEILLTHRQINFKTEEKSIFSVKDSDYDTNSAAGLKAEEKGSEKGKFDRGAKGGEGDRRAGEDKGEEDDDDKDTCNEGTNRRGKGQEEEERKNNEDGMLLTVGEREQKEEEERDDEEDEEYRVVEGVTDSCALYITAVRKDYPGFLFLRPDLYTAVSDPCLQVRYKREGTGDRGEGSSDDRELFQLLYHYALLYSTDGLPLPILHHLV